MIEKLKFDSMGLIPAIIQSLSDGKVLMLAYMNAESLEASLSSGNTVFYSRSRKELWKKGETSGNFQRIVSIKPDCDFDTLLIVVQEQGPACHTGIRSCFDNNEAVEARV